MAETIKDKVIWDYIGELNQRIARLETGGKPLVGISTLAEAPFTLPAGTSATLTLTFEWNNANVTSIPHAIPPFTIYIDSDGNINNRWPDGSNINDFNHNIVWHHDYREMNDTSFKQSIQLILVQNLDTVSHDYYFDGTDTYISGQSGSQAT